MHSLLLTEHRVTICRISSDATTCHAETKFAAMPTCFTTIGGCLFQEYFDAKRARLEFTMTTVSVFIEESNRFQKKSESSQLLERIDLHYPKMMKMLQTFNKNTSS